MREQRKIRNFFIRYNLQMRITGKFLILAFIFALVGEVLVYLVELPMMRLLIEGSRSISKIPIPFLLFWYNIPLIILILLAGIVITHRIAGPVYKIEQKLDQVIQGEDITPIRLRKGDELHELAEKLNMLIIHYQELRKSAKR